MNGQDWVDQEVVYVGKITNIYDQGSKGKRFILAIDERYDYMDRPEFPARAIAVTAQMRKLVKIGDTIKVITIKKYDDVAFVGAWFGEVQIA
jgi:hypothetical protein